MRLGFVLFALLAAGPAMAADLTAGALRISDVYAIETPPSAKAGAGYLSITNEGDATDTLQSVRTETGMATIHATETDADGVARMKATLGVEIAPGETVTLAPGGTHVMFMELEAPFVAGTSVNATLVFEQAGEVPVTFDVVRRGDAPHQQ